MLTNPVIAEISRYIKDEILYGRLAEHQRISERSIAERFSVSRTLVRESILLLKQEGFLYSKNKPHHRRRNENTTSVTQKFQRRQG